MSKEEKAEKVKLLAEELRAAELVVLTDYSSFDVKALHSLRQRLRHCRAKYRVVKNNILRRAIAELGVSGLDEHLAGPNAVTIAEEDATTVLKEMSNFLKEHADVRKAKQSLGKTFIKVGLLAGKLVEEKRLLELAQLPSREVMLGVLASTLQAPISSMARALNGIVASLAFALKDLASKGGAPKAAAEGAAAEGEPSKAEEAKPEAEKEEKKEEKQEEGNKVQ